MIRSRMDSRSMPVIDLFSAGKLQHQFVAADLHLALHRLRQILEGAGKIVVRVEFVGAVVGAVFVPRIST